MHLHPCGYLHTVGGITVRLEEGGRFPRDPIQLQLPQTIRNFYSALVRYRCYIPNFCCLDPVRWQHKLALS